MKYNRSLIIDMLVILVFFGFVGYIVYFLLHNMKITSFSPNYIPKGNIQTIMTVTDLAINRIYNIVTIIAVFFTVLVVPLGVFQYFKIREIDKLKAEFEESTKNTSKLIKNQFKYLDNMFKGDLHYNAGNYSLAKRYYDELLPIHNDLYENKGFYNEKEDFKLYYKLAICSYEEAITVEDYEKVLSLLENNPNLEQSKLFKNIIGMCYYHIADTVLTKDKETAYQLYEKALNNFQNSNIRDNTIKLTEAWIYLEMGRLSNENTAKQNLDKALNISNNINKQELNKSQIEELEEILLETHTEIASLLFNSNNKSEYALDIYIKVIDGENFGCIKNVDNIQYHDMIKFIIHSYIKIFSSNNAIEIYEKIGYIIEESGFDYSEEPEKIRDILKEGQVIYKNFN